MKPRKILCVCVGNADRSPAMATILQMYLHCNGLSTICESAGLSPNADKGGPAPEHVRTACQRIGINMSNHKRRHIKSVNLGEFDLIITVNDEVAAKVIEAGADVKKVYNANIPNPWPVQFQDDYDQTFALILGAMYRVVSRYFP